MLAMLISHFTFLIKLEVSRLLAVFHCRFTSLVIGSSSTFSNACRSNLVDDICHGCRLRFRESGAGNVTDGAAANQLLYHFLCRLALDARQGCEPLSVTVEYLSFFYLCTQESS